MLPNAESIAELLTTLVDIPSPTHEEAAIAEFVELRLEHAFRHVQASCESDVPTDDVGESLAKLAREVVGLEPVDERVPTDHPAR